jgi:hypothetical protein
MMGKSVSGFGNLVHPVNPVYFCASTPELFGL